MNLDTVVEEDTHIDYGCLALELESDENYSNNSIIHDGEFSMNYGHNDQLEYIHNHNQSSLQEPILGEGSALTNDLPDSFIA